MIDLQVNGFKTKDFSCNFWDFPDDLSIKKFCKFLYANGTKAFLATVITDAFEKVEANIERINKYKEKYDRSMDQAHSDGRAHIIGVHMEGGMISRMGVHPMKYALEMHQKNARALCVRFPGLIKLWTLCPVADNGGTLTKFLQDQGVLISYGHSNARYEDAMKAFDKYKVRLVTHWANAMYTMHNFEQRGTSESMLSLLDSTDVKKAVGDTIGLGLAAYRHPDVYCMAIAGSVEDHDLHLEPSLLKKLAEKKKDKFILVSDVVAYQDEKPPESLVGGLNTLKKHQQNAIKAGIPVTHALEAVSKNPQKALEKLLSP